MRKAKPYLWSLFFTVLLVEIMFRGFFAVKSKVPFFEPSQIVEIYYPELSGKDSVVTDENTKNILVLGGSVIGESFGPSNEFFANKLEQSLDVPINIINMATPGHASLDSYYKFSLFPKEQIDLVLLYHGINETRANNCPSSVFKNDYSHIARYRDVKYVYNGLAYMDWYTTPFGISWVWQKFQRKFMNVEMLPTDDSMIKWVKFGGEIKTKIPFKKNFQHIIDECEENKIPLMLMTFSYYLADNYTEEKFANKELDYIDYLVPISRWGKKENVIKGIDVHNEVVKSLVDKNSISLYLDMKKLMPQEGKYFDDPCHFSVVGVDTFTTLIGEYLKQESEKILD